MDFSQQQANPRRNAVGFSFVVVLHLAVVYALVTGLAQKMVEVVRAPIETTVIEEPRKPPPADVVLPPPPPQMDAPPPPFIPPPEVQIQQAPPQQPAITVQQATPPPVAEFKPMPPAPAPEQAVSVAAGVACPNFATVMGDVAFPRDAMRQGIDKGEALIEFTVTAGGTVKDLRVVSASHAIFARNSLRIVSDYKCKGQGHDVLVQVPFGYRLE
ncbi:MAG TPA: energy transducer TonB [Albitalea sp.]